MKTFSHRWLIAPGVAAAVALSLLAGCEEEGIRTYVAPPDPPRLVGSVDVNDPGFVPPRPDGELTLDWTMPDAWHESSDPPNFVLVAYDNDAHTVQTTVSRLDGAGGGALANINRWRGQIGLPAVAALDEQPMVRVDTASGDAAAIVDLVGEAGTPASAGTYGQAPADQDPIRILAAILPRTDPAETWFFRMTGPRAAVEAEYDRFVELVSSARLRKPQQP
jgi:hypothetical protein